MRNLRILPGALPYFFVWLITPGLAAQNYTNNYGVWSYTAAGNAVTITGFAGSGSAFTGSNAAVTIPGSINGLPVTTLATNAFSGDYMYFCSVVIPNSVTSLEMNAFGGCTYLTNVLVGTGVTNLGTYAFQGCTGLEGIYFLGNAPAYGSYVFSADNRAMAYYLPFNTGWTNTFAGVPTAVWNPAMPQLSIATYSNQPALFFVVPAAFPASVGSNYVIQMTTNLSSGTWVTITNYAPLVCVQITNAPARAFFRLR